MDRWLHPDAVRRLLAVVGLPDVRDVAVVDPPTRAASRQAAWASLAASLPMDAAAVVPLDVLPGGHFLAAAREVTDWFAPRVDAVGPAAVLAAAEVCLVESGGAGTAWHAWMASLRDEVAAGGPTPWCDGVLVDASRANLTTLVAEAEAVGLHPVVDAHLPSSSLALLEPRVRAYAAEEITTRGDRWFGEQLVDLVRNQFRRSLVVTRRPVSRAPLVFDADALFGASFVACDPDWRARALEPLDVAAELSAPGTPSSAREVVAALRASGRPVPVATLAPGGDYAGLLAAWELGLACVSVDGA